MGETFKRWYTDPVKKFIIDFSRIPSTTMVDVLPDMTAGEKRDAARYPFINLSTLTVNVLYKDKEFIFHIPKGFRWDGATIPSFVWFIVGSKTENRYRVPSMIHDYLCNNKYVIDFDRKLSSEILRALLRVNGVAEWRVFLMYFFVELRQMFIREWS